MPNPSLFARTATCALCAAFAATISNVGASTIVRHGQSQAAPATSSTTITSKQRAALLEQQTSSSSSSSDVARRSTAALAGFTDIHDFAGPEGEGPQGALLQGVSSNLYGETQQGGTASLGTIYKVGTTAGAAVTTFHSFAGGTADGATPNGGMRNVIGDVAISGYLYGVTLSGGKSGNGAIFRTDASGKESLVYSFTGGTDGGAPAGRLLAFIDGAYYGTTSTGGKYGFGTVYKLNPKTGALTTLHAFNGASDGGSPLAGLSIEINAFSLSGNLYGVTTTGGTLGAGTIYAISTSGTFGTVYNFANSPDASAPESELIPDLSGNLYGVASGGGSAGIGTIFESDANGHESIVHDFAQDATGNGPTGGNPFAPVSIDYRTGIIYGTASAGGANALGVVYRLDPSKPAATNFTLLHQFGGADGAGPEGKLVVSFDGNLYGTTNFGGANGDGIVFGLPIQ
ncbi:MAG: hypothetical protein IAI48_01490 [Candidatus Eremiobacteraeota bacterium]|nr:hypothetical protein [Candidatus Eremiobacteraeota bacterium]